MSTLTPVDDLEVGALLPARADTDSWVTVVANVARLAAEISATSFVPKGLRGDPAATTAAILYGREVGFPPMTALSQIHVIEGRPSMSAEGMRALVLAAGHDLEVLESDGAHCRMRGKRARSSVWTGLTWTLDDGRRAGLLGRDNWRKYPRAMLVARCTGDLCRMVFPDVIHGFRTIEEAEDLDEAPPTSPTKATTPRKTIQRARKITEPTSPQGERDDDGATSTGDSGPTAARPSPVDVRPTDPPLPPLPTDPPADPPRPEDPGEIPGEIPAETMARRPVDTPTPEPPGPALINRGQQRMMFREFTRLGVTDEQRSQRIAILEDLVGRGLSSSLELTRDEAFRVLALLASAADLRALKELAAVPVEDPPAGLDDPLPVPDPDAESPTSEE